MHNPNINVESIITKDFLQNVLNSEAKYNSNGNEINIPEIISYSVTPGSKPGDNYMSLLFSVNIVLDVKIDNKEGEKCQRHLLIKCFPDNPSRQVFAKNKNIFFKELEIYRKWLPELKKFQQEVVGVDKQQVMGLPFPKFVHGECIDFESVDGKIIIIYFDFFS